MIPVLTTQRRWYCPNCGLEDVTRDTRANNRFHNCPKFRGLVAPMLPAGTKAKVETKEREDYIGTDAVPLHEGRPIMSVVTTRDDGQDTLVFAPSATGKGH